MMLIFSLILSCSKNESPNNLDDDFVYPMKVGYKWEYEGLIKRSALYKDIIITGETSTDSPGACDSRDESIVTKIEL